ncbi:MAG: thiamine monophosphate kinase, partial [Acidimicrobiales bacterium]
SRDIGHIAAESGIGIELVDVPVASGATEEEALGGGEDYELVFAAAPEAGVLEAFAKAGLRAPIRIGRCVEDRSVRTLHGERLPITGWEHDIDA